MTDAVSPPAGSDLDETDFDEDLDAALPTFAILARFRETSAAEEVAVAQLVRRLDDAKQRYDEVAVERQDEDTSWLVTARFMTVSVDASTAVAGVLADLQAAGLRPDEVWAQRQIA